MSPRIEIQSGTFPAPAARPKRVVGALTVKPSMDCLAACQRAARSPGAAPEGPDSEVRSPRSFRGTMAGAARLATCQVILAAGWQLRRFLPASGSFTAPKSRVTPKTRDCSTGNILALDLRPSKTGGNWWQKSRVSVSLLNPRSKNPKKRDGGRHGVRTASRC
jgi:hypothetical protein